MEFNSVLELKNHVMPALKIRKRSLKKIGIEMTVDEIWDFCVINYFKNSHNLSLFEVVDYILNKPIIKDDKYE